MGKKIENVVLYCITPNAIVQGTHLYRDNIKIVPGGLEQASSKCCSHHRVPKPLGEFSNQFHFPHMPALNLCCSYMEATWECMSKHSERYFKCSKSEGPGDEIMKDVQYILKRIGVKNLL
jgi:hypothetical protein